MRPTTALKMFRPSRSLMATPKEEQSAHTISQRILSRTKSVPPELWPLAFVVGVACTFGTYSIIHKLLDDKTIRLSRQNRKD